MIHILGICGTFMGGIAAIAREAGLAVEGSDRAVYPPMSDQLNALGITLRDGFDASHLQPHPDCVIVGNALSRGNPALEYMLDARLDYCSGPEWLGRTVLKHKTVLAVAGTHGKTTTTAMLAWILECAGLNPGFLIGGVPKNFPVSARLGSGPHFVIEADEYDTAFFDKRSKFVHYRPTVQILNNLEFDHADIFDDLAQIKRQFHHLVRIVPSNGALIVNRGDSNLTDVLKLGCWTPTVYFGLSDASFGYSARLLRADGSEIEVVFNGESIGQVRLQSSGTHNVENALAALAAAVEVGVDAKVGLQALASFAGVKRRLERLGESAGVTVWDDFAHHPTAVLRTLEGFRQRAPGSRLIAVLEPRSNSMRLGAHAAQLAPSLAPADRAFLLARAELKWDTAPVLAALGQSGCAVATVDELLDALVASLRAGDQVVFMSNGGFENAQARLLARLAGAG